MSFHKISYSGRHVHQLNFVKVKWSMPENNDQKITIDNKEYDASNLSNEAKQQIQNIQFVDAQIQQLNNEWAIADTARIGYTRALNQELAKTK